MLVQCGNVRGLSQRVCALLPTVQPEIRRLSLEEDRESRLCDFRNALQRHKRRTRLLLRELQQRSTVYHRGTQLGVSNNQARAEEIPQSLSSPRVCDL